MVAKRMDLEFAETLVINYVKEKLSARIACINTEKDDDVTLTVIPSDKYFSTWTEQVNNEANNFIYYNIVGVNPVGIGPTTAQEFLMQVVAMSLEDLNTGGDQWRKKMFRYSRCIQETIQLSFKDDGRLSSLEVETVLPQRFAENERSPIFRLGGIQLTGAFA